MVIDRLEHAKMYESLGEDIAEALRFFEKYQDDGEDLPAQTELRGGRILVKGVNYTTEAKSPGRMEAHRKYIDVMYVVEGEERIFYKPFAEAEGEATPYDEGKECALVPVDADAASLRFSEGHFLIFFPQDGHLAAQLWQKPCKVRKFIAKVPATDL
jgi:YhcH/YjgK/YiaL family protein